MLGLLLGTSRYSGEWGIEIAGAAAPRIAQTKPARLEIFRTEDDIRQLTGQQEGWRMGPGGNGRGVGGHHLWLPGITANRLHGITGLEEHDPGFPVFGDCIG